MIAPYTLGNWFFKHNNKGALRKLGTQNVQRNTLQSSRDVVQRGDIAASTEYICLWTTYLLCGFELPSHFYFFVSNFMMLKMNKISKKVIGTTMSTLIKAIHGWLREKKVNSKVPIFFIFSRKWIRQSWSSTPTSFPCDQPWITWDQN